MVEVENPVLFERVSKFLGKNIKSWNMFKTIEELVKVGEQQRQEFASLSESIEEMGATIEQYQLQEKLLIEQNKKCRNRIFELKQKTGLEVYEENLELRDKIAQLQEQVKS